MQHQEGRGQLVLDTDLTPVDKVLAVIAEGGFQAQVAQAEDMEPTTPEVPCILDAPLTGEGPVRITLRSQVEANGQVLEDAQGKPYFSGTIRNDKTVDLTLPHGMAMLEHGQAVPQHLADRLVQSLNLGHLFDSVLTSRAQWQREWAWYRGSGAGSSVRSQPRTPAAPAHSDGPARGADPGDALALGDALRLLCRTDRAGAAQDSRCRAGEREPGRGKGLHPLRYSTDRPRAADRGGAQGGLWRRTVEPGRHRGRGPQAGSRKSPGCGRSSWSAWC